jgi:hypothetical protein
LLPLLRLLLLVRLLLLMLLASTPVLLLVWHTQGDVFVGGMCDVKEMTLKAELSICPAAGVTRPD